LSEFLRNTGNSGAHAYLHSIQSPSISICGSWGAHGFYETILISNPRGLETGGVNIRDIVADDFETFAESFNPSDAAVEGVE
jgi:hypothetical protein